jgi:hypothetical protein
LLRPPRTRGTAYGRGAIVSNGVSNEPRFPDG